MNRYDRRIRVGLFAALVLAWLDILVGANSVSLAVTWNAVSNTLSVPANATLGYNSNAVITVSVYTGNGIVSNTFQVHSPTTTQAASFNAVNGAGCTVINNVTICSPIAVNTVFPTFNPSSSYQSNMASPIANVIFSASVAPEQTCNAHSTLTPSWNSSVLYSNSTGPCNVNVIVSQIPKLNLVKTIYPGNSVVNIAAGVNVTAAWPNANVMELVRPGQVLTAPGGYTFEGLNSTQLFGNATFQDEFLSSLAPKNCTPGGLINLWDPVGHANVTMCTQPANKTESEALALVLQTSSLLHRNLSDIGTSWASSLVFANQGSASWKDNYTNLNKTTSVKISNLTAEVQSQNTIITNDQNTINNNYLGWFAIAAVIVVIFTVDRIVERRGRRLRRKEDELDARTKYGG